MRKPIFRFEFLTPGGGDRWSRNFPADCDLAAIAEGQRLLESQAVLRPGTTMSIGVSREDARGAHPLGTWLWSGDAADWRPPLEAADDL